MGSSTQGLSLDRGVDPVVSVYLSADVDFERRVRRVWADDRAPQVLLMQLRAASIRLRHRECRMDHSNVHVYGADASFISYPFVLGFLHTRFLVAFLIQEPLFVRPCEEELK